MQIQITYRKKRPPKKWVLNFFVCILSLFACIDDVLLIYFVYIFVCIVCISQYVSVLMRLATVRAKNTSKYIQNRHIHTQYIQEIRTQYIPYKSVCMCMYVYECACMLFSIVSVLQCWSVTKGSYRHDKNLGNNWHHPGDALASNASTYSSCSLPGPCRHASFIKQLMVGK